MTGESLARGPVGGVPDAIRVRPLGDEPDVEVVAVDLVPTGDAGRDALAWALARTSVLDADERRRAARFADPARGRAWTAARVVVRHLLAARRGVPPEEVRIRREASARPRLTDDDPAFSVSRWHRGVLLALAPPTLLVGVDGEPPLAATAAREIVPLLHPGEVAVLGRLADDEIGPAATRAWTRKEAYLKAIGTGLRRDPSLDLVGAGPSPLVPSGAPEGTRLVDLPPLPRIAGHAALCVIPADPPGSRGGQSPAQTIRWTA